MAAHAGEGVQPLEIRDVRLRGEAGAEEEVARCTLDAIACCDAPLGRILVEVSGVDARVEEDILLQVQLRLDVREIALDFFDAGVFLRPHPVLPDAFVGELVEGHFGVDAGAGVAVPVPHAA